MASVLAIISKAVFEKQAPKGVSAGDLLEIDRYTSSHAAFAQLRKDDAIFLVTVRPPKEALWLVGVLDHVKRVGDAWVGATNQVQITDVTPAIKKLTFSTGQGIKAKAGALGMSLQTPRILTAADVTLLRGGASPAVTAYRTEVEATPAGKKARAQAEAAAAGGVTVRFVNYRQPFTMLDELPPPQQKQLTRLTRQNRAGKPAGLVDDENWAPMELVDVQDVATGEITHQFYTWPWGSGQVFVHDMLTPAGVIIQHGWDLYQYDDLPLRTALAAAYGTAKPKLRETIDFQLDAKPPTAPPAAEVDAEQRFLVIAKRIAKELGKSKERYRAFEDLTKAQQAAITESLGIDDERMAQFDLEAFGLPPFKSLRRWAGQDPASPLELRAGKWPVWKWLKAASRGEIEDAVAVAAIGKALDADEIAELCRAVCGEAFDYDLFDEQLRHRKGEIEANALHGRMVRLFAALLDGFGPDAAVTFAKAAQKHLAKTPEWYLAAIATFALAARARRLETPLPSTFYKLAQACDFLAHGGTLRGAIREVVEAVKPADREAFIIGDNGPVFTTSYDTQFRGGKEIEVPCVLGDWHVVDLAPTERLVKAMVDSMLAWEKHERPPVDAVLDIIDRVGPVAIPAITAALRKKSTYKGVLEKALARLEKVSATRSRSGRGGGARG